MPDRADRYHHPGGRLIFHLLGALAEFERDPTQEHSHTGLAAARARGRIGGQPNALIDLKQIALAQALYDGGQTAVATMCRTLGISSATLYRYIDRPDGRHRAMNKSNK